MFRIARIRLAGVGPADARFDKPSPDAQAFEINCLGAADEPADSVVWLENGGGKTVLLSLLFHVLRPDTAAQIGNDDQGGRRADIGDFVLTGDVAHVVCEWVADDSAERILTGLVAERRGGRVERTWYLMSVRDAALSLDDLVFDTDGRRLPVARYLESLERLATHAGKTGRRNRVDLTKALTQRAWFDLLSDHDLDPALFAYQVRMNRSEGGATSLFRFPSAERFVEFFLQLTLNADTVAAVSEELVRVAEKVAALPRKELELAHATGAVGHLARLEEQWQAFQDASTHAYRARHDAESLHDRLHAAVAAASQILKQAQAHVQRVDEQRLRLDRTRRETDTRAKLAALAHAAARIDALSADVKLAEDEAAETAEAAHAWPRVSLHQRRAALEGRSTELRRVLDLADRDAAPLRARRDRILRALRRELAAAHHTAARDMTAASDAGTAAHEREQHARTALGDLNARVSEIGGLLTGLNRDVEDHLRAVERAVTDGVLTRSEDPSTALEAQRHDLLSLTATVNDTIARRHELVDELRELRGAATATAGQATDAEQARAEQQRTVDDALRTRRDLTGNPLLADLGASDADLDLVGADLITRVNAEATDQRAHAVAAAAGAAEDRRAADHLERDRLLPARAEVDLLCRLLHEAGIRSAVPGWRYLVESIPAARHEEVIAAHPAVLEGIVVATDDLDRASEVLADAAPAAAILLAAGATLTGLAGRAVGAVVPPAAAMHRRDAAEAELSHRHDRLLAAEQQAAQFAGRERTARLLADTLDAHLTVWPAGTLPAAVSLAQELTSHARLLKTHAEQATAAVNAAEDLITDTDEALQDHRSRIATAERRISQLEHLTASAERAARATGEIDTLTAERDTLTTNAQQQQQLLAAALGQIDSERERHQTAERAAAALQQQLNLLPQPDDGDAEDGQDIAGLRASYEGAVTLVEHATNDSDLAHQVRLLEEELAQTEAEWSALPVPMRERVSALAATPAATDPLARHKAEAAATVHAQTANAQLVAAKTRLSVARAERDSLPAPEPTWPVEPFTMPTVLADLERFAAHLAAESDAARAAVAAYRDTVAAAAADRDAADTRLQQVQVQTDALGSTLGDRIPWQAAPFAGDAGDAVRTAMRALTDTGKARADADTAWRRAAHDVGVFARDDRWNALEGELSRRLRDDQPDDLARGCTDLLHQTRILQGRLRDDIERLDTHRQVLVTSLGDAINEAARSLRSARKKSVLPDGLGEWSGHPFLKIGLDLTSDRAERDGQLRRFTNDLLERAAAVKASLPTGASLICQAVLACAERTITVDILKPNKAQRLRYVPITDTATLSGGMRATAAIAMFCTLAKVRAANRTGKVGVGTLILDNPFGDANATYLVALQRLVAQMNGVQLIYTTGVNDMDALRLFPVITRLTNEIGKRSHLAYVRADTTLLKRLAPSDPDNAVITGTRLVRQTAPILTTDLTAMPGEDE